MVEWGSYSLADFLMFSPGVYRRLFELENQRLWPWHLLIVPAGIAIALLLLRADAGARRAALVLLAGAWGSCAWLYFHLGYATIHTFGNAFAALFGAQAAALLLQAAMRVRTADARPTLERIGVGLFLAALLVVPLAWFACGRPLAQTEVFALMPDPTALATIGALLALRGASALLFAIPSLWSLYSGFTLYTMQQNTLSGEALAVFAATVLALAAGLARSRRPRGVPQP